MLLAIDPSIMSLGWAVLTHDKLGADAHPRLRHFGTVKRATGHLPLEQRINAIIEGLEEAVSTQLLQGKTKENEFQITQELYYCEKHSQIETYNEMDAECADVACVYLKKGTIMTAIGSGEFEGGGHCTSLDPSWYTLVIETQSVTVVIEKPQLWGSYKSTGSLHQGALLGLHVLVGALYWWANTNFGKAYLIPVTEWKGQLPKAVTQKRMEKKYDVKFETDDESDACGLGDYFIDTMSKLPI